MYKKVKKLKLAKTILSELKKFLDHEIRNLRGVVKGARNGKKQKSVLRSYMSAITWKIGQGIERL